MSVDAGLTTTRHFVYKTAAEEKRFQLDGAAEAESAPRLVSVSAECRLNAPPPLDRTVFQRGPVVVKRAFHRHKAGGGQCWV